MKQFRPVREFGANGWNQTIRRKRRRALPSGSIRFGGSPESPVKVGTLKNFYETENQILRRL